MRAPHITVEFLEYTAKKLHEELRQGSLDFALAAAAQAYADSSIECSELMTFPLTFAVRANGELARATSLADLCDAEWVHADTTDEYPRFVADMFSGQGLPVPRRVTRCTSQSVMYSLAISIDAVMAWASHTLELVNATGHMKKLDFIETSRAARLHLMQREGAILTRPADYFIRCIRNAASM